MKLVCIFYLHNEIIHTDAFTKPCNASLQTLNFVSKCPEDKVETASKQKNCTAFNTHGKNCQPLQYHCVLSDDLKHIVEVCAPSINIIGGAEIIRRVVVAEVEGLRHLVLSPPNMFWISYGREIILIDINGKKIRVIPRLKYTFGAHSITKEGRLLYLNGSSVKRLSDDSVSEILFTISEENSWNTRCIYSSNNTGKIIIGLHNKDANLGKLHLYSINGKLEQTIENDNDGKPLFKWPRYITENYNADIVTSDWKIGIIVTDVFGNHRFTYPLTCARAVVTDSQGRIYVCNRSPQIYIIDKAGNLLTNILTNTEDIFSLYLINDSELYAGCDSNKTILVYDVQHLDLNQSTTF